MRRITWIATISAVALSAGCADHGAVTKNSTTTPTTTTTAADTAPSEATNATAAATAANDCAAIKTSGWKAWVNAMPGPGMTRTLHIVGTAAPTTLGWTFALKAGPLTKSMPPVQVFDFVATKPTGQAGQTVPNPQEVRGEVANAQPAYRSVDILCGRTTIATVPVSIVE